MSKAGDVALQATCDGFDSHNFHERVSISVTVAVAMAVLMKLLLKILGVA